MISDMFENPMLWRFVGLASSTIGLVCHALSSSFRRQYGEWNNLKMFVYGVMSLAISFIMFFAEKFRDESYFRFKTGVVFLVLMLTSLYSVFLDETPDGKPDGLSAVSYGAFAVMSFCLSRQIQLGFESGMSNFFLGCFTVELMKINLILTAAAAFFCYFVIVLRSLLGSLVQVETADNDDENEESHTNGTSENVSEVKLLGT